MKNIRKAWIFVLTILTLTVLLTLSAYADGPEISVPTVMSTGEGSTQTAQFSAQEGKWIYQTSWVLDDNDGGNLYLDTDIYSSDLNYGSYACINVVSNNAQPGNYRIHCDVKYEGDETIYTVEGMVTVSNPTPPPARPSFSINSSSTSYMIGSESILLSVGNKQNMDGYTVHWWCENNGAVGGLSAPTGDSVYADYTAAGKSRISAYVEFGTETIWANNEVEITVTQAVMPTDVTLNYYSYALPEGQGITLYGSVIPENATSKRIKFRSSDDNIVQCVDNDDNTATIWRKSSAGDAIITAYVDGYPNVMKQCSVTLPNEGSKTVFISADEYYPDYGQTVTVKAKFNNTYDSDNTLTHWVYDKNILEMTYNDADSAKFKAIKNGSTRITAYAKKDGEMYGVESNTIDISVTGAAINHQITYGNYATFDGTNPLYFITNDYITNFKGVIIDGYALTNGNQYYSSSSSDGHILVALNPAYLKMLSSANYHTIQIYSTVNGPATGYFRNYGVTQTIYGVKTGDENNIALWVTLGLIGLAGASAIVITKRKEIFGK